jgi:hypothetical protein
MHGHKLQAAVLFAGGAMLAAAFAMGAEQKQKVQTGTIVTVVPQKETPGGIPQSALHLKVNGKETEITRFVPLHSPESDVELVILIDDGARTSLGTQMSDIAKFIQNLRPGTKVSVGYMYNGMAQLAGPLTTDHNAAIRGLHLPMQGGAAISASPYFCLSSLAKNWPSSDMHARREVVMITDGIDYYEVRYDPEDPYVQAAMDDAVRAHLIVYAIYWRSVGFLDRTQYGADDGQNLLAQLTAGTGGTSYWMGLGNPVSFIPYFEDINRRLDNQYEMEFMTTIGDKPEMQTIKLSVSAHVKVDAPQEVWVYPVSK